MYAEARIIKQPHSVFKHYKENYFRWNKVFNRLGEKNILEEYESDYFVNLLGWKTGGIFLERFDTCLGDQKELLYETRVKRFQLTEQLTEWLSGLREELKRIGLAHHDINPSNIVFRHKDRKLALIDFTWARPIDDPLILPRNIYYSWDDGEAIDALLYEIEHGGTKMDQTERLTRQPIWAGAQRYHESPESGAQGETDTSDE